MNLMIKRMSNIEGHSAGDIIHSISDSKSLDLFALLPREVLSVKY